MLLHILIIDICDLEFWSKFTHPEWHSWHGGCCIQWHTAIISYYMGSQAAWLQLIWMVIYKIQEQVDGIHGASRNGRWLVSNGVISMPRLLFAITDMRRTTILWWSVRNSDQEGSHVDDEGSAQRMKMTAVLERPHVRAQCKSGGWYGHLCYSLRYMRRGGFVATVLDTTVFMPSYRV